MLTRRQSINHSMKKRPVGKYTTANRAIYLADQLIRLGFTS